MYCILRFSGLGGAQKRAIFETQVCILTALFANTLQIPVAELHGLGSGCSFIQKRGIGYGQARDVADHGLVVEERLQATLRDLWLVGCILSHPEYKRDTLNAQHNGGGIGGTKEEQWNVLCDFWRK